MTLTDLALRARTVQEDVEALQVSMDDSFPVEVVQAIADLHDPGALLVGGDGEAGAGASVTGSGDLESVIHTASFAELHDQGNELLVDGRCDEFHNIRVIEVHHPLSLLVEAVHDLASFCLGQLGDLRSHFDCNQLVCVIAGDENMGLEDHAEGTSPEFVFN